jgi:hydrogenase 3 maturation protease
MDLVQLRDDIRGRVVVVGVGNPMRGDDGLGPDIVDRLRSRVEVPLFDCGEVPENFIGAIAQEKPDTVLVLDAADFSGQPGDIGIFSPKAWRGGGISTHGISLRIFADLLSQETGARIFLVSVQPQQIGFGQAMSLPVKEACDRLERFLSSLLSEKI